MICLVGATCSGKDTIKKELLKLRMDSVVTTTTRPMREGEIQDITYHFVDESVFKKLEEQGYFAESISYDTIYGKWFYGSAFKDLENNENKVSILNPDGIKTISEKMDMSKWFFVYLHCSDDIIMERLKNRGDDPKEAERRLEADRHDFMNIERFVDISICNDGSESPERMAKKIKILYEKFLKERN